MGEHNLWIIFTTGLLTGGLSCLAVQGGLLAASIAQREEEHLKQKAIKKGNALPILAFLAAKLVAYAILGLLLGWFGSLFELSLTAQAVLQIAVAIFMIGTAGALLNLHPLFRYFIIQPPKFITRKIRSVSKSGDLFAPAILGAFTVFIPCGVTQGMMALAIASTAPAQGAAIMFAFVLGTSPVFFILGYLATRLGDRMHKKFMRVAAYAIVLLALFNFNNGIALTGKTNWTLGKISKAAFCTIAYCAEDGRAVEANKAAVSEATIVIENYGYTPRDFTVKAGSEVKINLINKDAYTCAQAFTIPSLGIRKIVAPGASDSITFTAPKKAGQLAFMCSMGMYRGVINIIN